MKKTALSLVMALLVSAAMSMSPTARAFKLNLDFDKIKDGLGKAKTVMFDPNESEELEMGKGIAANILGAAPLVDDPELQNYVNRVGKWVAMHSERPNIPWRFGVLDDNQVNAFATPGGYIFITRGMLMHMRDEAELAGVLGHEITHVVEKHVIKTMREGARKGLLGDALSAYAESKGKESLSKVVSAGTEIYTRGLDKDDEYAADRAGVVLAGRAGYDPYGLPSVLQTLASINPKDDAVALMFKTHPDSGERLKLITDAMEGKLDKLADQPRVANRFSQIMQAHVARYKPAKQ